MSDLGPDPSYTDEGADPLADVVKMAIPGGHEPSFRRIATLPVYGMSARYARSGDIFLRMTIPREVKSAWMALTEHPGVAIRATFEVPDREYTPPPIEDDVYNEWGVFGAPIEKAPPRPVPDPAPKDLKPEDLLTHLLTQVTKEATWTLRFGDQSARNTLIKTVLTLATKQSANNAADMVLEQLRLEQTQMRAALQVNLLNGVPEAKAIEATATEDVPPVGWTHGMGIPHGSA